MKLLLSLPMGEYTGSWIQARELGVMEGWRVQRLESLQEWVLC